MQNQSRGLDIRFDQDPLTQIKWMENQPYLLQLFSIEIVGCDFLVWKAPEF